MALSRMKPFLRCSTQFYNSYRTTIIMKRRFPIPLQSFEMTIPPTSDSEIHLILDKVEDHVDNKHSDVKVILTEFKEGVGERGDVVSLKADFARKELLLSGKAVYASPENLKEYAQIIQARLDFPIDTYSSKTAPFTIKALKTKTIQLVMSATEPWTIEPWHIRVALRNANIYILEEFIEMPATQLTGPDMGKDGKEFAVWLTINKREKVPVCFRLSHSDLEINPQWALREVDPILKEQTDLLLSIRKDQTNMNAKTISPREALSISLALEKEDDKKNKKKKK